MAVIKSSSEHLTINADGSGRSVKFQANGVEKASIDSSGNFTSTSIDATKLSGALPAIDGSALTGITTGKVLQVVSAVSESYFSTNSSTPVAVSNLSKTLTTTATNSKILITMNANVQLSQASDNKAVMSIRSSIDSFGASLFEQIYTGRSEWLQLGNVIQFLHSPNQTAGSVITYTAYAKKTSGTNDLYIPYLWGLNTTGVPTSSVVLMEIGA